VTVTPQPKVLYLLHASAGQWHTVCTLSSFSSPHSRQSCRRVSPSVSITGVRVVWPVNSPTASVNSLPEALLFYLAEVHWVGSWTDDNLYRSSTCSGAPVSNDSWWLLDPQQRGCQRFGTRILKFGWKLELQKRETCSPPFRFYSHSKYLQFLEGRNKSFMRSVRVKLQFVDPETV
jgi:hypothetical protein